MTKFMTKRKYKINFDKTTKKYFGKMLKEFSKQLLTYQSNPQTKSILEFYAYLEAETSKPANQPIMVSFEELEFLKSTMSETIRGMERVCKEGPVFNGEEVVLYD